MTTSIDFETYLIDDTGMFPKPVCLSYYDGEAAGLLIGQDEMHSYLADRLGKELIVAHNATFELGVIYRHFPDLQDQLVEALKKGLIVCTKIYEQLLNNQRFKFIARFGLDALVKDYFGEDISEDKKDPDSWRMRYSELDGVEKKDWPQDAIDYAINDSIWAYKVYEQQKNEQRLTSKEFVEAEFYLNLMGDTGIETVAERVEQLEEEMYGHLESAYSRLIEQELCSPVKGSRRPKKNMKLFREYIKEKVKDPMLTDKGVVSTTGEALTAYYTETEDPVFKDFITVNTYDKILTAYVSRLKGNDLIRSQYSAVKTTGRTSSSGSKLFPSVNIQQMPRKVPEVTYDIRNCFKPRKGFKLVAIDYAGLELACAAHQLGTMFKRGKMKEVVNRGNTPTDMHSMLACKIMSIKEEREISYEHFVKHKKEPEYAWYRQLSKPINLGFPGGIGYDTMRGLLLREGITTNLKILVERPRKEELIPAFLQSRNQHPGIRIARLGKKRYAIVIDELVELKKAMFELYPELEKFLKDGHKLFETGEFRSVKNDYGEWEREPMHRYSLTGFTRDWCTYTAVCNGFLMQSPGAIGAKRAVVELMRKYHNDPNINMLAFIHDEVLFEVLDNDDKYATIKNVSEVLIDQMHTVIPSVRVAVEASIMDYWDKAGGDWEKMFWKNPGELKLYEE